MEITYSAETVDLDAPAHLAAADRPGKPVRLRVQPTLLRGENYQAWAGVSWTADCPTAADAIAVRDALRAFFLALEHYGAEAVQKALTVPTSTT